MKIINGGAKDYYDWYESVLGMDDTVVYDRRKFIPIDTSSASCPLNSYFSIIPLWNDRPKKVLKYYWSSKSIAFKARIKKEADEAKTFKERIKTRKKTAKKQSEGLILHLLVEIGDTQWFFEIERYLENEKLHLDVVLIKKDEHVTKRYGGEHPITIIPLGNAYFFDEISMTPTKGDLSDMIHNPILEKTFIPSFITPQEAWCKIYEFLSSLKDKEIIDSRTNDEHILNAGFDTKNSFRPNKKS